MSMSAKKKLQYFEDNLQEIWSDDANALAEFILESLTEKDIKKAFKTWPNGIKIKVVERHLKTNKQLN